MNIKLVKGIRCFDCFSEFIPTISKPICTKCGFLPLLQDFSCFHHNLQKSIMKTQVKYDQEWFK